MRAKDIMTAPVVTVAPDASVRAIARLLLEHRISAVPVVEEGRVVGLVSEGDLFRRAEIGTEPRERRSWWLGLFDEDRDSAVSYVKAHARCARDLMTRDVVSVSPDTPVSEIAALLEKHGIKRVPVLEGERLVGIVSRANLVQALALQRPVERPVPADDEAVRATLLAKLEREPWWERSMGNVIVDDGVVHLWGTIDVEEERAAARVAAQNTPGVRRVEDHRVLRSALPGSY